MSHLLLFVDGPWQGEVRWMSRLPECLNVPILQPLPGIRRSLAERPPNGPAHVEHVTYRQLATGPGFTFYTCDPEPSSVLHVLATALKSARADTNDE